ncbi:MAG: hypothetical protein ACXADL_04290 [Candidatus Thorarchaeota archaeon]|jgi:hypothetical protein
MQMLIHDASEIIMAVFLVIASVVLLRFTMKRTADLPLEDKHLGRPLYLSVLGTFLLGISSLLNFLMKLLIFAEAFWLPVYYIIVMIGASMFAFAALYILGWRRAFIVPAVVLAGAILATLIIIWQDLPMGLGFTLGPVTLILYIIPLALFGYLFKTSGRITSLALFLLLLMFLIFPLSQMPGPIMSPLISGIRTLGPAIMIVAFSRPTLGPSAELFGYSIAGNTGGFWLSLVLSIGTSDMMLLTALTLLTTVACLGIGIGVYCLSRYRASRNTATLTIGFYFLFGSISYLMVALQTVGFVADAYWNYTSAALGFISVMFLNLSAFIALDWKRVLLLPVVIMVPGLLYMFTFYPLTISLIPNFGIVIGITNVIQTLTPIVLYALLWRRMSKVQARGRMRPLFLSIGILISWIGSVISFGTVSTVPAASILFIAYLIFGTGVTGLADKYFGKE